MKRIVVLGGPNGAGKTSFAQALFSGPLTDLVFVNADEIARGLEPFAPDKAALAAGRLMLSRTRELVAQARSFAIETTCAGRAHLDLLRACRQAGWHVTVLFLWLPSAEIALRRVQARAANGGHAIPSDVVVRRYRAGLRGFFDAYLPNADAAAMYDGSTFPPPIIAEWDGGLDVRDARRWLMVRETLEASGAV